MPPSPHPSQHSSSNMHSVVNFFFPLGFGNLDNGSPGLRSGDGERCLSLMTPRKQTMDSVAEADLGGD